MSWFGGSETVTTRKPHACTTCGRIIPVKKRAFHSHGMWEGDWQNWYACMPCVEAGLIEDEGDGLNGDEFMDMWNDDDRMKCPVCEDGKRYYQNDCEWSDDGMSVEMECTSCGHKWSVFIGFDAKSVNPVTGEPV